MLRPTYETGVQVAEADWVRVFAPAKGVWHHGIVRWIYWVGNGFAVEIANNVKGHGVIVSDWYDFADGQTVYLQGRASFPGHAHEIRARVESNLGKPYDLFAQSGRD